VSFASGMEMHTGGIASQKHEAVTLDVYYTSFVVPQYLKEETRHLGILSDAKHTKLRYPGGARGYVSNSFPNTPCN
jgi:hypothetical protein